MVVLFSPHPHNKLRALLLVLLVVMILFGFWLRFKYIYPSNMLFGYDQYHSLFSTRKIALDHHLVIIGPIASGKSSLHHGVFFYYYNIIPFIIFNKNPIGIALYNSFFNALSAVVLFYFSYTCFKKILPGLISAYLATISFEYIKFSGWVSNPTITLMLTPVYFLGLWSYYQKQKWGLALAAFVLGIIIQSELFFLYLIVVFILYFIILKPPLPGIKLTLLCLLLFVLSISTMIVTEFRQNFSGIYPLIHFSTSTDKTLSSIPDRIIPFVRGFGQNFSNSLLPQHPAWGIYLGLGVIILTLLTLLTKLPKQDRAGINLLLIYLFSPALMLVYGYQTEAWFLIGLPPAILLLTGYLLARLKLKILILVILIFIGWNNLDLILNHPPNPISFYNIDASSLLKSQLEVMDYTYQQSFGRPFAINTVTYPLYQNEVWAYDYDWYGQQQYHYLPGWLGGDQLYPYNLLPKSSQNEKYFYLIIDNTYNIPQIQKILAKKWAEQTGKLIEEKNIGGFIVQKREYLK